ncbi:MAG: UDP-3-O-(3-hydroxymyristoyl)glucosamine N-acyltransferase [Acidobacteriota bacterium]|nr:UDP-3-O-(3-hydroxymyristoyl)glucosamine N-acyltransferase [Acidobacteriota bacterium]
MKLGEIAKQLGCELRGSAEVEITGVAGIEKANKNEITFVSNPKYLKYIQSTHAGAIVLSPDAPSTAIPTVLAENPYLIFAQVIALFYQPPTPIPGIHPTAIVADTAILGNNYSIGANTVIGEGVQLGDNSILYPNVIIYPHVKIGHHFIAHAHSVVREYCQIGDRVILQNGAVIGSDGFGFAPQADATYYKMSQSGIVVLENDVEVGANACIDRATVGETRIGQGTKLDNLVQVGHGSLVGRHTILAGQAGLAGSTKIGDHVMLGGQVGTAGHISIGDKVIATAQTGIARSVKAGSVISGTPEMDSSLWKRNYLLLKELPQLVNTIKQLKKELEDLKKKLSQNTETKKS